MGGEHTMQYTDGVLQNCTLETYVMLLTNVIPINFIRNLQTQSISSECGPGCVGTTRNPCREQGLWTEVFFEATSSHARATSSLLWKRASLPPQHSRTTQLRKPL